MTRRWTPNPGEISPGARAALLSGLFTVIERTEGGRTLYDLLGAYDQIGMTRDEVVEELEGIHNILMEGIKQ